MLTLDQLIAAATALPDDAKTIIIDKAFLQDNRGAVQTTPDDIALAQIRQLAQK